MNSDVDYRYLGWVLYSAIGAMYGIPEGLCAPLLRIESIQYDGAVRC